MAAAAAAADGDDVGGGGGGGRLAAVRVRSATIDRSECGWVMNADHKKVSSSFSCCGCWLLMRCPSWLRERTAGLFILFHSNKDRIRRW